MCRRFALHQCVAGMLVALLLAAHARAEEKSAQAAEADVNVRSAQASFRVAEAELAQALEANKKAQGTISQSEVRRLSLAVERAKVQVERAEIQQQAATAQPTVSESEKAIRKALDEKSNAQFMDTPLSDVVDFFADKHKILIRLDRKAFDDAGIGTDTPISVSLDGISLRSILNLMLKENDLTHIIKDEVLLITTRDEAGQQLSTVVYDVRDLVKVGEDDGYDYNSFIELVTSTIAQGTWDEVGGPGSIGPFDGMIVISQTQAVHVKIAEFLESLRKTRAARPPQPDKVDDPERVSLRVYDVVVPLRPVAGSNTAENTTTSREKEPANQPGGALGNSSNGSSTIKPGRESMTYMPDPDYLEAMATAIASTIEPQSWQTAGGQGIIKLLPATENGLGKLVIKQTGKVHAKISRLLKEVVPEHWAGTGYPGCSGGGFY